MASESDFETAEYENGTAKPDPTPSESVRAAAECDRTPAEAGETTAEHGTVTAEYDNATTDGIYFALTETGGGWKEGQRPGDKPAQASGLGARGEEESPAPTGRDKFPAEIVAPRWGAGSLLHADPRRRSCLACLGLACLRPLAEGAHFALAGTGGGG